MASANLGVPVAQLSVTSGVVSGGGKTVTYGELVGGKLFNITGANVVARSRASRRRSRCRAYTTVTKDPNPVTRIDIPEKVTGEYTYVHKVRVPGMLHGRMVRPRGQGAYPYNSNVPVSFDAALDRAYPGREGRPGRTTSSASLRPRSTTRSRLRRS